MPRNKYEMNSMPLFTARMSGELTLFYVENY